jgi:uncharacterized protein (DUF2141 family)
MFASFNYLSFPELKHKKIIFYLLPVVIISACAKIGPISGGDKDTIPPFLVTSKPLMFATNFNAKKVRMTFSEFIELKDLLKEFIVSPPMHKLPDVKNINKDLLVEHLDSLLPNTTYTLNFGNSVVDFTAGNALRNFEFVFSTGSSIDSLSVHGRLLNASDLTLTKEPVYVMLYNNLSDSAPYLKLPSYICRTDLQGRYRLNNLKEGDYRLFALKDGNNNMKFDIISESIAFDDSIIHLKPKPIQDIMELFPDTSHKATVPKKAKPVKIKLIKSKPVIRKDTVKIDSLKLRPKRRYGEIHYLFMFQELNPRQYLKDYKRVSKEMLRIIMNLPLRKEDIISLQPTDSVIRKSWLLTENHRGGDTIDYWITDTTLIHKETLRIAMSFPASDSTGKIYAKKDTLDFKFITKEPKKKKKDKEKPVAAKLHLKINAASSGLFDLNNLIEFEADKPVQSIDPSFIELYKMEDSIPKLLKFNIRKDSLTERKFYITNKMEESADYRLKVFPGSFIDIYGERQDTALIRFKTQKFDYYGQLIVSLDSVSMNMIVQVFQKDKLIAQKNISHNGKLTFEYMLPGKYKIKYIFDRNGNNKWDTGNYLKKLQPERVKFWWKEEEVRSGFDVEIQISGKE